MKTILIANSPLHTVMPYRQLGEAGWDGETITYVFTNIYSMDDAYRFAGLELYDVVWMALPKDTRITQYINSRIRRRRQPIS